MNEAMPSLSPTGDALTKLIARLEARHGFAVLDTASFDTFTAQPGDCVVLFAEDPMRVPETWDVAVVLPEVLKELPAPPRAGILTASAACELQARYGFRAWPALLFLRDGEYVGVIEGMRDWEVYRREVPEMLTRPSSRAPTVGIPVHTAGAPGGLH